MLLRAFGLLAVLLLLCTAGHARAESPSAAIADLNLSQPTGSQLLDEIRRDLSVAGYRLNESPELLRGLQGKLLNSKRVEKAKGLLESAQLAYENFDLTESLESLQEIDGILLDAAIEKEERELLAQRYLLAGLVRVAQNQSTRATNNFRLAHRLKPSLGKLDAGSHRPSVVKIYADAVKQNSGAKSSKLARAWKPEAARLYLDGQEVASDAKLSQGPHILTLHSEGYASKSVALSLGPSASHKIQLEELSRTEQLRAQRELAATGNDPKRFESLATLVGVDTLVLVRSGPDGPKAALYNTKAKALSAWVQVGSVRWESLLSGGKENVATLLVETESSTSAKGPWFKQWWGGSLIVGGTALVGTAIYLALSASDSSNMEATIDQWCFGSCN